MSRKRTTGYSIVKLTMVRAGRLFCNNARSHPRPKLPLDNGNVIERRRIIYSQSTQGTIVVPEVL
jgi:hypothetical protein